MISFWNDFELQEEHISSKLSRLSSFLTHWGTLWLMVKFSFEPHNTQESPNSDNMIPYLRAIGCSEHFLEQKRCFSDNGWKTFLQETQTRGSKVNLIPAFFLARQRLRASLDLDLSIYGIWAL